MLLVAFLTALSAPLAARAAKTPAADEANAPLPTLPELESWRPALKGGVQAQAPSLRERALRDTALAVGSQAALASRTRAQNAEVEHYAGWLDAIYRFDQLLAEAGRVLPPVVIEARRYAEVEGGRLSTIEQSYRRYCQLVER